MLKKVAIKRIFSFFLALSIIVSGFSESTVVKAASSWATHQSSQNLNVGHLMYLDPMSHEDGIHVKYWKGTSSLTGGTNSMYTWTHTETESNGITTGVENGDYVYSSKSGRQIEKSYFEVDVSEMQRPIVQIYTSNNEETPEYFNFIKGVNGQIGGFAEYFNKSVWPEGCTAGISYLWPSASLEVIHFHDNNIDADIRRLVVDASVTEIYVYDYPEDYVEFNLGSIEAGFGLPIKLWAIDASFRGFKLPQTVDDYIKGDGNYQVSMIPGTDETPMQELLTPVSANSIDVRLVGMRDKVVDATKLKISNVSIATSGNSIPKEDLTVTPLPLKHGYRFGVSRKDGTPLEWTGKLTVFFTISGIEWKDGTSGEDVSNGNTEGNGTTNTETPSIPENGSTNTGTSNNSGNGSTNTGTPGTTESGTTDKNTPDSSVNVPEESTDKGTEETTTQAPSAEETKNPLEDGKVIKKSDAKYTVTDAKSKSVQYAPTTKTSSKSKITIPDTVTVTIDGEKVVCKVTSIAKNAFKGNKKLTNVTIGKNVTSVGENAFKDCKNLTTVTLKSASLKKIGANAFQGAKKLKVIKLYSTKLTSKSISKNALKGTNEKLVIKVPSKKVKQYQKYFSGKGNKKVKVKAL